MPVALPEDLTLSQSISAGAKRPVTMADAIGMTTLGDADYRASRPVDEVAQFSPDGRKFLIPLRRGDLETNTVEYSLCLWRSDDAVDFQGPEKLLTMSSSTNQPPIEQINWQADNQTFLFLGQRPGEQRRACDGGTQQNSE